MWLKMLWMLWLRDLLDHAVEEKSSEQIKRHLKYLYIIIFYA